jgi:hypothetical protein
MSALATIALNAGFPLIRTVLQRKLGDQGGSLAADVLDQIATRAGVKREELDALAEDNQGRIIDAMRAVEPMTPELIALYTAGLEGQFALLQAEAAEGGWKAAWRPLLMYFNIFLWLWQAVLLHVANAIWKIALPPMPWEQLIYFTGISMGLYMGGHTVKDVVAKWVAK